MLYIGQELHKVWNSQLFLSLKNQPHILLNISSNALIEYDITKTKTESGACAADSHCLDFGTRYVSCSEKKQ